MKIPADTPYRKHVFPVRTTNFTNDPLELLDEITFVSLTHKLRKGKINNLVMDI